MDCVECGNQPKYKCPVCKQPYCSVACCKKHKESPCTPPEAPVSEPTEPQKRDQEYEFPTEDTVPLERLKLLEQSSELKKCLQNPHVREILEKLDKSPHPDALMQEYMQEPIFTEFVDICLQIVEPSNDES